MTNITTRENEYGFTTIEERDSGMDVMTFVSKVDAKYSNCQAWWHDDDDSYVGEGDCIDAAIADLLAHQATRPPVANEEGSVRGRSLTNQERDMNKHTPMPSNPNDSVHWAVVQGDGTIFDCQKMEAVDVKKNAPLIVRAVNAHDALVRALSAACGYMRNAQIDLSTGTKKATALNTISGGLKIIEEALKLAKGEA